jgi:hypothetical protein
MSDADRLTPADPEAAFTVASALRQSGRKRVHDDAMMATIVAKRLVEHLERSGYVIHEDSPGVGGAALGHGHSGR